MRALDVLVQAAVPALVDVAVLVDHRVVADVAPAQRLGVVLVHAADDARRLRLGVVVRARGVVDGRRLHRIVVRRIAAASVLVGAPAGAGDHARHARDVLRVDDRVDGVALLGVAVDEHGLDVVKCGLVVDGLDVPPFVKVVGRDAVGALRLLDVAGAHAGGTLADLGRLALVAQAAGAARQAAVLGGSARGSVGGIVLALGASGHVAGLAGLAAGAARAEEVCEAVALLVRQVARALDVVDGDAGTGSEDVEAVGGDLHGGGRLDVDELGPVEAVALAICGVVGLGAVPLRPGAVRAQGAEVAGHVRGTRPGQREHGELLVAAEFLDHAAARVLFVDHGLGRDGRVLHQHG